MILSLRNFALLTSPTAFISMRQAVAQFWVTPYYIQTISTSVISVKSWLEPYVPVQLSIQFFQDSSEAGIWPNIDKNLLLKDIKNTVVNPLNIRQAGTPFCGPASVIFELASREKTRYIRFCQELFETGGFKARSQMINASENTRQSRIPEKISTADWMMLATLRDSENALIPVDNEWIDFAGGITGITFPSELETWIYEVLGFDNFDFFSCYTSDELNALIAAHNAWQKSGVAFLLINLGLLKTEEEGLLPNHWIAFQNNFSTVANNEKISVVFDCYSWGKILTVNMQNKDLDAYLFGVVFGTP